MKKWALCFSLAFLVLAGPQCGDGFNLFPVSQDISFGQQLRDEMLSKPQEYPVIPRAQASEAYAFVDELRTLLLQTGEIKYAETFAWEIYLVRDDAVLNAFCAPGGYIFIYTGLIKYLDSTHELLGVLAHEMAHADERHSTAQLTKAYGIQLLTDILLGENQQELGQIATGLIGLEFSRADEREADARSVSYLCATPYRADGASGFFAKLIAEEANPQIPTFLSTHPDPGNRVQDIQNQKQTLGCQGEDTGDADYAAFKALF